MQKNIIRPKFVLTCFTSKMIPKYVHISNQSDWIKLKGISKLWIPLWNSDYSSMYSAMAG